MVMMVMVMGTGDCDGKYHDDDKRGEDVKDNDKHDDDVKYDKYDH